MDLIDQARARVAVARARGRDPRHWIATDEVADRLAVDGTLLELPITRGRPRSEWGLELVLAPIGR